MNTFAHKKKQKRINQQKEKQINITETITKLY